MSRSLPDGNVISIGIERSRRNHPSNRAADPAPVPPLDLAVRQCMATLVRNWRDGAPVPHDDATDMIDLLLGRA